MKQIVNPKVESDCSNLGVQPVLTLMLNLPLYYLPKHITETPAASVSLLRGGNLSELLVSCVSNSARQSSRSLKAIYLYESDNEEAREVLTKHKSQDFRGCPR